MNREIVLDTETTGFDPAQGDRMVEIGCVELINHIPTGKSYQTYLNPERDMPESAFKVHGLSEEFLKDKPLFRDTAQAFLDFIADDTLIIHNAKFDLSFLNAELVIQNRKALTNPIIDTVRVAQQKHPGARVNLDALCRHYGIDNSAREKHGALLDSEILAEVYLELIGGRQVALALIEETQEKTVKSEDANYQVRLRQTPLPSRLSDAEQSAHADLVKTLGDDAMWHKYQ